MQAAVLTKIRSFEICEMPKPQLLQAHEVLLRVMAAGVCGSDRHYYINGGIGEQIINFPFIIGHECTAVIAETGKNITRVKAGDRVAVDPAVSCGQCDQCLAGRPHTCRKLLFLGCPGQLSGCLAEYIVMPEQNCYLLPDNLSFSQGVLAEPLAIAEYALNQIPANPNQKIAILGAGPIGLCVLAAAQVRGIKAIYVTDIIDARLKAAQQAGAVWTGNPRCENIVKSVTQQQPLLLDAVFECCGSQDAMNEAVTLLKPGGKLVIIGIPDTERIALDIHTLRRKEIGIINVRRQNNTTAQAVRLLAQRRVNLDYMLTHTFPLAQTQQAFELVTNYADGVIKTIIEV